jgi:lipopolysaccharide export system permease protein
MRIGVTISRYIASHFFRHLLLVLSILATIIVIFDLLELVRRSFSKDVPISLLFQMCLLKLPIHLQRIMPFVVMIAGILCFSRLTQGQELVVMRAAGVSVWQFLLPAIIGAFVVGLFTMMVLNPISTIMVARYERLEAKHMRGETSALSVVSSGIWLKENIADKTHIIHATKMHSDSGQLFDVIILIFDDKNNFEQRLDAKKALLKHGIWQLDEVIVTLPHAPAKRLVQYEILTQFSLRQLQDSFASPETVSFWALPRFIQLLQLAGFSSLRHLLHWYELLVKPFFLAGMIMIGAAFSMRNPRHGRTVITMFSGIIVGVIIYFISDVISALGLSGTIPLFLAAVTPACLCVLIGLFLMLHLEDG